MKKTFGGATRREAKRQAREWWEAQTGLRKISETEVAMGNEGPDMRKADQWTVTIHYEPETSN